MQICNRSSVNYFHFQMTTCSPCLSLAFLISYTFFYLQRRCHLLHIPAVGCRVWHQQPATCRRMTMCGQARELRKETPLLSRASTLALLLTGATTHSPCLASAWAAPAGNGRQSSAVGKSHSHHKWSLPMHGRWTLSAGHQS